MKISLVDGTPFSYVPILLLLKVANGLNEKEVTLFSS